MLVSNITVSTLSSKVGKILSHFKKNLIFISDAIHYGVCVPWETSWSIALSLYHGLSPLYRHVINLWDWTHRCWPPRDRNMHMYPSDEVSASSDWASTRQMSFMARFFLRNKMQVLNQSVVGWLGGQWYPQPTRH